MAAGRVGWEMALSWPPPFLVLSPPSLGRVPFFCLVLLRVVSRDSGSHTVLGIRVTWRARGTEADGPPPSFWRSRSGLGPAICISDKLLGTVGAVAQGPL